jgi:hypothetical protein
MSRDGDLKGAEKSSMVYDESGRLLFIQIIYYARP